jgi:putative colanic acid biosynthesis acetyltransferase WcaF
MGTDGLMSAPKLDENPWPSPFSLGNRALRAMWAIVWLLLFRPSPRIFHAWRRWLLRLFGARIGRRAHVYPSVKIWAPWNLELGDHSCLGSYVDCYNVAPVHVGAFATVSQYSYLCTATHDYNKREMPLIARPIKIGDWAWVAADVYVGPGVTIGDGCVVGARSSVHRSLPAWCVAVGNPAKPVKSRAMAAPRLKPTAHLDEHAPNHPATEIRL